MLTRRDGPATRIPGVIKPPARRRKRAGGEERARGVVRCFASGLLRNFGRLDMLLGRWADTVARRGHTTFAEAMYTFMARLLFDPADFRISNGTVYFTASADLGVHFTDLTAGERAMLVFMVEWSGAFFANVRSSAAVGILPEFGASRHNAEIEALFPRAEMCARFVAQILQPHVPPKPGEEDSPGETPPNTPASEAADINGPGAPGGRRWFMAAHHACVVAATRLQAEVQKRGRGVGVLDPVFGVLYRGWEEIARGAWDASKSVYPGAPKKAG